MSRLTEEMLCACDGCELYYDCDDGTYSECEKRKFYEKVQYYEDLEEQGYKMVNIDKIAEQLEEKSWSVGCSFAPKENRTAIIKTEKAIEIVKGSAK